MAHIDYDFSTTNANVVAMLFSRPITGTFSAHVDTDDLVIGIGPVVVEKERLDDPVCPECTIAVLVVFKDIDLHIVSDDLGIGLAASSLADSVWAQPGPEGKRPTRLTPTTCSTVRAKATAISEMALRLAFARAVCEPQDLLALLRSLKQTR